MSDTVLKVENLSVAFRQAGQPRKVVRNISFQLEAGLTYALVGESGSGKSVTALSVLKLLPYPSASHPSGKIFFNGEDILGFSEKQMRRIRGNNISMIFQEPMTALNPLHKIQKQISEVLKLHQGMDMQQARERTLELLHMVRIPNPESRLGSYPHELSGGQRQRVMIAMALANNPKLLIADEPTTALDVTVQKEILELLKRLQQETGMSMLLITHDLGIVKHFSDKVSVMRYGEIVESNNTTQLFASPEHPYTRELLASSPKGGPVGLESIEGEQAILKTEQLKVSFPLENPLFRRPQKWLHAVDDVAIQIEKGSTLGVVGESGSGKSTLAMAILRLIKSSGKIRLFDTEVHALREREFRPLRREIQVVFQDPFASLSPRMTIGQIIAEGLNVHESLDNTEVTAAVEAALMEVGLDPNDQHRYPHEFSGGQRQRVAIARAIILKPKIVVLDEPTSALDRAVQVQVIDLLRDIQKKYRLSYIFISHDLKIVRAISHKIAVMRDGKILEYGDTEQVLSNPTSDYTRALFEAAF